MTQTVLITGASAGIGLSTSKLLLDKGYRVIGGARRTSKLEKLKHPNFHGLALDVCDNESVDSFLKKVKKITPHIDVLINNAGMALGVEPIHAGKTEDWEKVINTNIMGVLRMTRKILPDFIEKNSGQIINIGSIAGHFSYAGGGVYAGTKHMLKAITQAIRLEINGTPIRVCSVSPGLVETEFSIVRLGDKEKADKVYSGMEPLTGEDIAECILFCMERPKHVNIDDIIVMPTAQASVYKVHRQ